MPEGCYPCEVKVKDVLVPESCDKRHVEKDAAASHSRQAEAEEWASEPDVQVSAEALPFTLRARVGISHASVFCLKTDCGWQWCISLRLYQCISALRMDTGRSL